MKILIALGQYDSENNGTTISTRQFVEKLTQIGNEVRVLACGKDGANRYNIPEIYIPIATELAHKQGMFFVKPVAKIIKEAVTWCDIVHLIVPFLLCKHTLKEAKRQNKPYTAAFHVQAQNITYNIKMAHSKFANSIIYKYFYNYFYKYVEHVHCPSNFIANQLRENNYDNIFHVISNGVNEVFKYDRREKPKKYIDKFVIAMVGRLSREKRQDILINSIKHSKYTDKIKLIFAGHGPMKKAYEKMCKEEKISVEFEFFKRGGLVNLLSYADLYVHTADVEIEAISCLEAISCGLVPIISDSVQSAASQFALDERSIFNAGNEIDLAEKIDYWYENNQEKADMGMKYAKSAEKYSLNNSAYMLNEMMKLTYNNHTNSRKAMIGYNFSKKDYNFDKKWF